jgi:hypothetical protein
MFRDEFGGRLVFAISSQFPLSSLPPLLICAARGMSQSLSKLTSDRKGEYH